MDYRDRIARDPVPRTHSEDDVAGGLASFVPEATFAGTSPKSEQPGHPLWEFPQEGLRSAAAASNHPALRKLPIYASLVAAILVAAIAGALWGKLIPGSRPVATAATARAIVIAPEVQAPAGASAQPPARLIPSVEMRPSTLPPPISSVVPAASLAETDRIANPPSNPGALPAAAAEQRQPPERATSMARGTSDSAPVVPIPRRGSPPSTEPTSTAPMVAENPLARSPAPEPPAAFEALPGATPPPRLPAPVERPEPEALPSVVARTEQGEIQRTLGQYRSAYQLLDAEAARAVWPSVDVRALARAFDSLASQQLAFEACEFDIAGEAATAQCRGSATYTPKVGSRGPRLEPRQWTFHLRKLDEGWKIQSAQTRR